MVLPSLASLQAGRRWSALRIRFHAFQTRVFELLSNRRVMVLYTVAPVVVLFLLINVFPIVWAIVGSFFDIPPFGGPWEWNWFDHYTYLYGADAFWQSMWRSVVFSVGSVVVQVIAGLGLALLVTRDFKFKRAVRAVSFVPYLIPTVVFGFMAIWMTDRRYGIINRLLVDAGVLKTGVPFFAEPSLVMPSLILVNSWKLAIFVTIMAVARLQGIPDSYYEAAEMAGAGSWEKFRDITFPNLKGVLFIVILLRFVWMFIKFDIVWVLTRGGPNDVALTAPLYAFETAFFQLLLGRAAAVSTVLFGLLVVAAVVYFRVLEPSQGVRVE